jgi:hypothetical protein
MLPLPLGAYMAVARQIYFFLIVYAFFRISHELGLEMYLTHQLLVYADDNNLLGEKI